jgi:type I restriction enzyme S subunit
LVCVRATIGEPRRSDGEYCLGRGIAAVRVQTEAFDPDYIFAVVEAHEEFLRGFGTGTTFKTISKKHIESIPVPLLSMDDQQAIGTYLLWLRSQTTPVDLSIAPPLPHWLSKEGRIVTKIERLAAKVEETKRLRTRAIADVTVVVQSARRWLIESVCAGVEDVSLADLCKIQIGATPARKVAGYWSGLHPWASIADLNDDILTTTSEGITDAGVEHSSVKLVGPGTLLMSFKLTIGKMAIAGVPMYTNEAIVALPIRNPNLLSTKYLWHALKVADLVSGTRDAIKGRTLNKKTISNIQIPLPAPAVQESVVRGVESIERSMASIKGLQRLSSEALDALLPSILDKAFKGEL